MTEKPSFPHVQSDSPTERVDLAIAETTVPQSRRLSVRLIGAATDLSDQEPLYAAAAGVLGVGLVLRDGPTWRAGTRILAAHLLATALRGVIKKLVDRTRPEAAARRGNYVLREGERHEKDFNSFPSGHAAGAIAVARAVGRDYPGVASGALVLAGATGAFQVVRAHHYASDIVAGAVIGWVAEAAIDRVIGQAARA
ncbi:hypothetical protein GCM10022281_22520 [Sphingomonas rosea]|uniref:Phosphatidic acid phosphatase type 2/haloperoxidase domain-containing protein n=1 Tax=Sphingomonas rosea TaxID=335605 RepID=A0ABP7UDG6_9SPHN